MKDILIREPYRDFGRISFLKRALGGSLGIHLFRLVAYFLISIMLFLALIIPRVLIGNNLSKSKRKRIINEFKAETNIQLNESDEYLFKTYMTHGEHIMVAMQRLTASQETLDRALSAYREWQKIPDEIRSHAEYGLYAEDIFRGSASYEVYKIEDLITAGFIKISNESGAVNPQMKDTLDRFVLFLKNKGMISKKGSTRITITGAGSFTATDQPMQSEPADPAGKK
jgi:hypothetical protein